MPDPTYAQLAKMLDHSLLQQTLTDADLEKGCLLAREYNVASVCIKPYSVRLAAAILSGSTVVVGTTIGFPHGGHLINLHIAAGLGLGGCEAYPGVFAPFGGYSDGCVLSAGRIAPTDAAGVGLEQKTGLAELIAELTGECE